MTSREAGSAARFTRYRGDASVTSGGKMCKRFPMWLMASAALIVVCATPALAQTMLLRFPDIYNDRVVFLLRR